MHVVSSEVWLSFAVASTHQSGRPLCGSIEILPVASSDVFYSGGRFWLKQRGRDETWRRGSDHHLHTDHRPPSPTPFHPASVGF